MSRREGVSRRRAPTQTEIDRHERFLGRKETWSLSGGPRRRCRYCGRSVFSRKGPPVCNRQSCVDEREAA